MAEMNFAILKAAKIRQDEFAEFVSVTRASVNAWVNGRTPVHPMRKTRISKYLTAFEGAVRDKQLPLISGMHDDIRREAIKRIVLEQLKKG